MTSRRDLAAIAWAVAGLSIVALSLATILRADIHHEPGPSAALYEAYLDHALETDDQALSRAAALAKDSSFLALEQALDAGRRGDRATMLTLSRRAIALDPNNCEALALLARVEFRMLESGMTRDEDVLAVLVNAEGAVRLGCADGEIFDRLASAHAVLAMRSNAANDSVAAGEHRAAQRRALETWAETLRQDAAYQRLADFARESDDAALEERALRALVGRQERTVILLQRLASVLQELGRCEEAIPLLEEAAASPTLDAYSAISVRVNLGQCALEVGPITSALSAFDKALELDPTNGLAAVGRAEALWVLERRAEAIDAVERIGSKRTQADAAQPRKQDTHREFDDALTRARWMSSRRLEEALPEARRAVGLAASGTTREQAAAQALLSAILLERGDFVGAEAAAREGLAREPSSETSLLAVLSVQWAAGRKADAVAEIARVERVINAAPSWLQRVARWEASRGLDEAARAHAVRALAGLEAASGPDPDAKGAVADVLLAAGDPAGAEALLRAALALRPSDEDFSFGLADALAEQGRHDEAVAVLPARDGADEYLLARLAGWHAVHPADPSAGISVRAMQLAQSARGRVGPGSHPAKLARFDGIVAGVYLAAHQGAEAARWFDDALGRDALQPPERWLGATTAQEMAGQLGQSLALAERAARLWPDETLIDMRRARVLIKLDRVPEGVARAENVLKVAGATPGVHAQVAAALADAGALVDARRIMDSILSRWPEHSSLWLSSGQIRDRAGDTEGAVRDLRRALELDPRSPIILNALGYMLADHGLELTTAVDLLRRAVAARPHEAAYLDSLGWALFRADKQDEAMAQLEKAVARDRDAVIVMHLATARDRAGRTADALRLYREALNAGLDEEVDRVEARVKELSAIEAPKP